MLSLLLPVSAFGLLLQPPALRAPRVASRQSVLPRMEASVDSQASIDTEEKTAAPSGKVTLEETIYQLAFVNSTADITTGPVTYTDVKAWKLTNDLNISVTVIRQGACAVKVEKNDSNYLW